MGREAQTRVRIAGAEVEAKALLETHELILRGERRAKWPLAELRTVAVDGDWLTFTAPDGPVALHLGPTAASWAKKMTAPPSLADKLGLKPGVGVQVVGDIDDAELEGAVAPARVDAANATLSLGQVASLAQLDALIAAHAALPVEAQLWVVNIKGPKSPLGENAIRAEMRSRGFMDNKTASVSTRLAATRYARRKA